MVRQISPLHLRVPTKQETCFSQRMHSKLLYLPTRHLRSNDRHSIARQASPSRDADTKSSGIIQAYGGPPVLVAGLRPGLRGPDMPKRWQTDPRGR